MLTVINDDSNKYRFVYDSIKNKGYIETDNNTWILNNKDICNVLDDYNNLEFLVGTIELTGSLY
jgi:hypothetical protein